MLALESERKGLEVKLTMKDREIARLENDKRWLAEREAEERLEKETLRAESESERVRTPSEFIPHTSLFDAFDFGVETERSFSCAFFSAFTTNCSNGGSRSTARGIFCS